MRIFYPCHSRLRFVAFWILLLSKKITKTKGNKNKNNNKQNKTKLYIINSIKDKDWRQTDMNDGNE